MCLIIITNSPKGTYTNSLVFRTNNYHNKMMIHSEIELPLHSKQATKTNDDATAARLLE